MKPRIAFTLLAVASLGNLVALEMRCDAAESAPAATLPAASDADKLLDAAVTAIEAQRKSVKNLTASGAIKSESFDPKTRRWQPLEERQATATYDGPAAGKCQIACPLSKTATPDGPDPFVTEKYVLIYDGQVSLKLTEPNNGLWIAMCEITAGPSPLIADTARATGLAYSTLGWREPSTDPKKQPQTLLAILSESRHRPGFLIEKITEGGRDFLDITAPRPDPGPPESGGSNKRETRFRLDIAKGYALSRVQQFSTDSAGGEHKTSQIDVTDFTEPAPGIFYPAHVDASTFGAAGKDESKIVVRTAVDVSSARINTPVSEDTFNIEKVELPVGTSNLRGADGEVIRFTPDEQQRLIARVAREVLAKATREHAAAPSERKP